MTRLAWRIRLLATCSVFAALAFLQSPGLTAADTKLDLTQNPGGFLLRSLHLWDDQAFFGQLQNQAYGYLFPMGPFFWLGDTIQLPPWVVQRAWWWLLICVGFLGAVRLARLLGIEAPSARWAAGLCFVLAPRVMTTIGPISAETLPYVLAPWVVVPLAGLRSGGSIRRAAALSGLTVLFMGGVNAVATAAAAGIGLIWILTETGGTTRVRLGLAWTGAVALASAWFLGPLLLLGRYSPPFLDWIESAAVTTSVTDGSAALRGVTDWVAYVGTPGAGPQWPAGWSLVSERALVLGTVLVALAGAVGLALRVARHRRFLITALVLGLASIVAAHVSVAGPLADGVAAPLLRQLLDGALAPLRNVHKFDVWVRLPLAMGVGWSVTALRRQVRASARLGPADQLSSYGPRWIAPRLALVALVIGVAGAAAPALRGDLTSGRTFFSIPGYWSEAGQWLATAPRAGRALVVPGAASGSYLWGLSRDEPLQPISRSPWAVRDGVPLSSAGNIRALDAVEALFADGRGSRGLATYLARMGVSYLVVRNDLNYAAVDSPRASLVHQSLTLSGGFDRVRFFGPLLSGFATTELVADGGVDGSYPAVEIFRVSGGPDDPRVVIRDASSIDVVQGESEALLSLADGAQGLDRVMVRSGDQPSAAPTGLTVATDAGRRWELDFGRVHDNRSSTLTPDDPWALQRKVHDYDVAPRVEAPTAEFPSGVTPSASSSRGDASSLQLNPANGPWNAVDSSEATAWLPRGSSSVGQWWQLRSDRPFDLAGTTLLLSTSPAGVAGHATITITTDAGDRDLHVALPAAAVRLPNESRTTSVRLTLTRTDLPPGAVVGIGELAVPDLATGRSLALAPTGPGSAGISVAARTGRRSACVVRQPTVCFPPLARPGEESAVLDRTVSTSGIRAPFSLAVEPRGGPGLDRLLLPVGRVARATASSQWVDEPSSRSQAAVDRDPWTAWVANPLDKEPTLRITLPEPVTVSRLRINQTLGLGASTPFGVTVQVGARSFPLFSDAAGFLRFPPTRTRTITLRVTSTRPLLSIDTSTGQRLVLPAGISDLDLGEADRWRQGVDRAAEVDVPCGFGPSLTVGARSPIPTEVSTTIGAILDGAPAVAHSCAPAELPSGRQRIVVRPSGEFWVSGLTWAPPVTTVDPVSTPDVREWSSTDRVVEVPAAIEPRTLELGENANPGWTAWLEGVALAPVRVDGWRQAWVLPAGAGGVVRMAYSPDQSFQAILLAGAVAALGLIPLGWIRGRGPEWQVRSRRRPRGRGVRAAGAGGAALVICGPAGSVAAVMAAILVRSQRVRIVVVSSATVLACTGAIVSPWPVSAGWSTGAATLSALVVAISVGAIVGALVAPLTRSPSSAQERTLPVTAGATTAG